MFSNILSVGVIGASLFSAISAAPFSFSSNPLRNGFPTPSNVTTIEVTAHGSLPDGKPPATPPTADSFTSLRLIAFNELFEVAFFTELIANITSGKDDKFKIHDHEKRDFILKALTAVQAQEELHALNANGALKNFLGPDAVIQPCQYNFPVSNFEEAIALASTFTDVVLGTLQDVTTLFGSDGDSGLIRGVASVIGQEGEQNGYYRTLLHKQPSALPFLTTSTREFAFSALQGFVVPGSCPNLTAISLQIFQPLSVTTPSPIKPESQDLSFSFTLPSGPQPSSWKADFSGLSLTYINQQNVPVNTALIGAKNENGVVSFTANFPFNGTTFGNGLTIAAVTNTTGPFTSADEVAKVTVFGPGLIEIN